MKSIQNKLVMSLTTTLIIGAVMIIITLLPLFDPYQSDMSQLLNQWLISGILVVAFSLMTLGCITVYEKKGMTRLLFWGGVITALIGLSSGLFIDWVPASNDLDFLRLFLPQLFISSTAICFSCSYLSVLSLSSPRSDFGKAMLHITTVLVVLTTLLIVMVTNNDQLWGAPLKGMLIIPMSCILILVTSIITIASNKLLKAAVK